MAFRCPFCRSVFPEWKATHCPHCGKTLLPPGYFSASATVRRGQKIWTPPVGRPGGGPAPKISLSGRPLPLLLVISVLVLAGVGLVHRARNPAPLDERGNIIVARQNMEVLTVALDLLREHSGRFPAESEGLVSLVHNPGIPGWQGPYIIELKPDPWGRRFEYRMLTNAVAILSSGPDRTPGTDADIVVTGKVGVARQPIQLWQTRE